MNESDSNTSNGFRVPESYWEQLRSGILEHKNRELVNPPQGFVVPDTYFEQLNHRIQQQVTASAPKGSVIPFHPVFKYVAAAAILVCVAGILFWSTQRSNRLPDRQWEQLSESDYLNYLQEYGTAEDLYSIHASFQDEPSTDYETEDYILFNS